MYYNINIVDAIIYLNLIILISLWNSLKMFVGSHTLTRDYSYLDSKYSRFTTFSKHDINIIS